jgi:hypothetical protein
MKGACHLVYEMYLQLDGFKKKKKKKKKFIQSHAKF